MARIDFNTEPPTLKQIRCAEKIHKELGISLPDTKSKSAYGEYINKYVNRIKKEVGYCDDNPLGVPGVSGIDCYDLGISPWGSGFFDD